MKNILVFLVAAMVLVGSVAYANEADVSTFISQGPQSETQADVPISPPPAPRGERLADEKITVSGSASVTLKADYATVALGVSVREKKIADAQKKGAEIANQIIKALKSQGIDEADIHTSNFSLYPNYDNEGQGVNGIVDYTIENTLMVTIRNLDTVAAVLDSAIAAGANHSYGLSFLSSKSEEAYLEALPFAIEKGLTKAQALALGAGKEVGELISIKEESLYGDSPVRSVIYNATPELAGSTPIMENSIFVVATVTLEYAIK